MLPQRRPGPHRNAKIPVPAPGVLGMDNQDHPANSGGNTRICTVIHGACGVKFTFDKLRFKNRRSARVAVPFRRPPFRIPYLAPSPFRSQSPFLSRPSLAIGQASRPLNCLALHTSVLVAIYLHLYINCTKI